MPSPARTGLMLLLPWDQRSRWFYLDSSIPIAIRANPMMINPQVSSGDGNVSERIPCWYAVATIAATTVDMIIRTCMR